MGTTLLRGYLGREPEKQSQDLAMKRLLELGGALGAEANCRGYGDWNR